MDERELRRRKFESFCAKPPARLVLPDAPLGAETAHGEVALASGELTTA